MTVLCEAVTCKHNNEFGEKAILGTCSLEVIVLKDVEREDFADDFMACQLYMRGSAVDIKENKKVRCWREPRADKENY